MCLRDYASLRFIPSMGCRDNQSLSLSLSPKEGGFSQSTVNIHGGVAPDRAKQFKPCPH
jgi:hypothetical protein